MDDAPPFRSLPDYRPVTCRSPDEVTAEFGGELDRLVGRAVRRVWVTWDRDAGEWYPDGPVFVDAGRRPIGVCVWGIERLLLSARDDFPGGLDWNCGADTVDDLDWAENPPIDGLDGVLGREVRRVGVGECTWDPPHASGRRWALTSLEFDLDDGQFAVENALDENDLRFEPPEDLRVTWIAGP